MTVSEMRKRTKPADVASFEKNSLCGVVELVGGVNGNTLRSLKKQMRIFEEGGGGVCEVSGLFAYRVLLHKVKGGHNGAFFARAALSDGDNSRGIKVLVAYNNEGKIVGAMSYRRRGTKTLEVWNLGSLRLLPGAGSALEVVLANIASREGRKVESNFEPRARVFHQKIGRWVPKQKRRGVDDSIWGLQDVKQIAKALPIYWQRGDRVRGEEGESLEELLS